MHYTDHKGRRDLRDAWWMMPYQDAISARKECVNRLVKSSLSSCKLQGVIFGNMIMHYTLCAAMCSKFYAVGFCTCINLNHETVLLLLTRMTIFLTPASRDTIFFALHGSYSARKYLDNPAPRWLQEMAPLWIKQVCKNPDWIASLRTLRRNMLQSSDLRRSRDLLTVILCFKFYANCSNSS